MKTRTALLLAVITPSLFASLPAVADDAPVHESSIAGQRFKISLACLRLPASFVRQSVLSVMG
jgi:hypothetical protein